MTKVVVAQDAECDAASGRCCGVTGMCLQPADQSGAEASSDVRAALGLRRHVQTRAKLYERIGGLVSRSVRAFALWCHARVASVLAAWHLLKKIKYLEYMIHDLLIWQ